MSLLHQVRAKKLVPPRPDQARSGRWHSTPIGLCVPDNAVWAHQCPHGIPGTYQWLRDFLKKFVFIYLDDILISSCTLDEHIRSVLQQLLDNRLYVKTEKYEFHQSSVQFLGFIIPCDRLQMKQFVVEVDASDAGVWAILSQRAPDNKMQPCAFFSRLSVTRNM